MENVQNESQTLVWNVETSLAWPPQSNVPHTKATGPLSMLGSLCWFVDGGCVRGQSQLPPCKHVTRTTESHNLYRESHNLYRVYTHALVMLREALGAGHW